MHIICLMPIVLNTNTAKYFSHCETADMSAFQPCWQADDLSVPFMREPDDCDKNGSNEHFLICHVNLSLFIVHNTKRVSGNVTGSRSIRHDC